MNLFQHQQEMLLAMGDNNRGIIQCPTGGGKTYTFVTDSRKHMQPGNVIVVVAPRLLLIEQLFSEFDKHLSDIDFLYREISSEGRKLQRDRRNLSFRITPPQSATTYIDQIKDTYRIAIKQQKPLVLFVTYDSLERVLKSGIPVEVTYYDEAHNAVSSDKFDTVKQFALMSKRNYFFTATPLFSPGHNPNASGMDNINVYGEIICQVNFNKLIERGVIVKPVIHIQKSDVALSAHKEVGVDFKTIEEVVDHYEDTYEGNHKILFCTRGTKSIKDLIDGGIVKWANSKGYRLFSTDSVNGKLVDGVKVKDNQFLELLNQTGDDKNQKMLVLHYSQIAEGIDIKSFTGLVFLRQSMSEIFTTQSIGRVIRSAPGKTQGIVTVIRHTDDTGEAMNLVDHIIGSLRNNGVPPEVFVTDEDGRGDSEEVVENISPTAQMMINQALINWEHSCLDKFFTEKVATKDPTEFVF